MEGRPAHPARTSPPFASGTPTPHPTGTPATDSSHPPFAAHRVPSAPATARDARADPPPPSRLTAAGTGEAARRERPAAKRRRRGGGTDRRAATPPGRPPPRATPPGGTLPPRRRCPAPPPPATAAADGGRAPRWWARRVGSSGRSAGGGRPLQGRAKHAPSMAWRLAPCVPGGANGWANAPWTGGATVAMRTGRVDGTHGEAQTRSPHPPPSSKRRRRGRHEVFGAPQARATSSPQLDHRWSRPVIGSLVTAGACGRTHLPAGSPTVRWWRARRRGSRGAPTLRDRDVRVGTVPSCVSCNPPTWPRPPAALCRPPLRRFATTLSSSPLFPPPCRRRVSPRLATVAAPRHRCRSPPRPRSAGRPPGRSRRWAIRA